MLSTTEPRIVTIDEGDGPVKAVKDPSGRIVKAEQVLAMHQRQQAEASQAQQTRDKLLDGDAEVMAQVVAQVKEGMDRRLALLERQKADLEAMRAKLQAGDAQATADVVKQAVQRLGRRVEMATAAQARSAALLEQLDPVPAAQPKE